MENRIRVLIASDCEPVLHLMRSALQTSDDVVVAGEAQGGMATLELAGTLQPEVVLLDWGTSHNGDAPLAGHIRDRYPATKIIVLGSDNHEEQRLSAFKQGAWGYLPRGEVQTSDLLVAVIAAARGGDKPQASCDWVSYWTQHNTSATNGRA